MEHVLFKLHEKSCSQILLRTSSKTRWVIESCTLTAAVISFCTVLLCHRSYVFYGRGTIPLSCFSHVVNIKPLQSVDVTHIAVSPLHSHSFTVQSSNQELLKPQERHAENICRNRDIPHDHSYACNHISSNYNEVLNRSQFDRSFSFSSLEGYLSIPDQILERINVTIQYIFISKNDKNCFGEDKILEYALDYILAPIAARDVIALNWLLGFQNGLSGFVKSHKTNQIFDLSLYSRDFRSRLHFPFVVHDRRELIRRDRTFLTSSWESMKNDLLFKFGVLLSSLFLFFMTTSIVSFTLRTTQARMLQFTIQLQRHIRQRKHFSQLVIVHCVETMVFVPIILGTFFFLTDCFYFNDKVLSFTILSGIWVCEIFSAVFMRTIQSSVYFPQVFFAYFTLFHIYYFSCPFGFTFAALSSITLFLLHSMLFFVNRFELPAFASGQVSRFVPRMAVFRHPSIQASSMAYTQTRVDNGRQEEPTASRISRSNSFHRMANGMSYPSMSSLGRIVNVTEGFEDSDYL